MFFNRHARRLGDFAAGTMVIKEQAQVTLETLGQRAGLGNEAPAAGPSDQVIEGWRQRYPRLRHLRTGDYELIRETLRRHDRGQINPDVLQRLTDAIARKVETTPPTRDWQASRGFLSDVAEAYRHLVE
jgi:hypothetical protein